MKTAILLFALAGSAWAISPSAVQSQDSNRSQDMTAQPPANSTDQSATPNQSATPDPSADPDQTSNPSANTAPAQADTDNPTVFKVNVVGRTTKAINYHFRSGSTKVDLAGTDIAPRAHGHAEVSSHLGRIDVDLSVGGLDPPQHFGSEYLTYVAWAITPEGRAQNLGEIVLDGGKKINVTTDLQAFGIIVTAEPYFTVTQPSDLVVLENRVRPDTVGASEYINAKYELIATHQYIPPRANYEPETLDPKVPLALHEARNAVRIAQLAGAEQYASDSFDRAATLLKQAEEYQARKHPEGKPIATVAREATQDAEDARLIAVKKKQEEFDARQRAASAQREAEAQKRAQEEQARRAQAEQQAQEDQAARAEAQRRADEAAKQEQEAEAASKQALAAQQQAEQQSAQAQQLAQQAQQQSLAAQQAQQQAEREREELRQKLLQQFNMILETRDSARGLIVNMSDVLFDTAKYSLKPGAREKLAKLSGIVLAYPGLKLAVEGHTDNVGSDAYNQRLSERRAETVKDYLVAQGLSPDAVTAQGFGKTQPVASNATAAGRQQNRRVEIVVSGEVIGTTIGPVKTNTPGAPQTTPPPTTPQTTPQTIPQTAPQTNQPAPETTAPASPQTTKPTPAPTAPPTVPKQPDANSPVPPPSPTNTR